MRDFTKRYTQIQIDAAKAYIQENFDTRAASGEDYDRLLDQVLQVLNPTGRPWEDVPSFLPKPAAHRELEEKYLGKQPSTEEVESAKAWVRTECGPMSEAAFELAVQQVLRARANPQVVKLDGGFPINMYGGKDVKPFPEIDAELFSKPIEATYLPAAEEEPLLNVENIRKLPEMQRDNQQTMEDRTVARLMLAMARGEIKLELDGTPGGKARDMRRIKDYLDTNADIDGALAMAGTYNNNPAAPTGLGFGKLDHLLPSDGDELNVEMVIGNDSIRKRLVGPWDGEGWDKGMSETVRQERLQMHEQMQSGQPLRLVDPMRGLSQEHPLGPIWFEDPDNMHVSKFVRDEDNILHPNYKGPIPVSDARRKMHEGGRRVPGRPEDIRTGMEAEFLQRNPTLSRAAKHVIVTPIKDRDE